MDKETLYRSDAGKPQLDNAALYGLAGDIVKTLEPETEADPVALLIQFLVAFGNVIGRRAHFVVGATRHYMNLFTVLVGPTASARKGTSWDLVKQLFTDVDPGWSGTRIQEGLSTGEGLIYAVRDQVTEQKPVKFKGKVEGYQTVVKDPGVDDKRLLVYQSEFASVLRVARRPGNTLTATTRQAWDSGNLRILTRNNPLRSTGVHVSITGHITEPELVRSLTEMEMVNGFANRFLWLCVSRSQELPGGGKPVDLSEHSRRLADAVRFAANVDAMHRNGKAKERWHAVYHDLTADRPGLLGAITNRAPAQVLRLSCLYALLDKSRKVRAEHLNAALALWRYAEDSAAMIFGAATGNPDRDKLLTFLRTAAPEGKSRTELHDLFGRHCNRKDLDQLLEELQDLGLAEVISISTGGRPAERWFARLEAYEKSEFAKEAPSSMPGGMPTQAGGTQATLACKLGGLRGKRSKRTK